MAQGLRLGKDIRCHVCFLCLQITSLDIKSRMKWATKGWLQMATLIFLSCFCRHVWLTLDIKQVWHNNVLHMNQTWMKEARRWVSEWVDEWTDEQMDGWVVCTHTLGNCFIDKPVWCVAALPPGPSCVFVRIGPLVCELDSPDSWNMTPAHGTHPIQGTTPLCPASSRLHCLAHLQKNTAVEYFYCKEVSYSLTLKMLVTPIDALGHF